MKDKNDHMEYVINLLDMTRMLSPGEHELIDAVIERSRRQFASHLVTEKIYGTPYYVSIDVMGNVVFYDDGCNIVQNSAFWNIRKEFNVDGIGFLIEIAKRTKQSYMLCGTMYGKDISLLFNYRDVKLGFTIDSIVNTTKNEFVAMVPDITEKLISNELFAPVVYSSAQFNLAMNYNVDRNSLWTLSGYDKQNTMAGIIIQNIYTVPVTIKPNGFFVRYIIERRSEKFRELWQKFVKRNVRLFDLYLDDSRDVSAIYAGKGDMSGAKQADLFDQDDIDYEDKKWWGGMGGRQSSGSSSVTVVGKSASGSGYNTSSSTYGLTGSYHSMFVLDVAEENYDITYTKDYEWAKKLGTGVSKKIVMLSDLAEDLVVSKGYFDAVMVVKDYKAVGHGNFDNVCRDVMKCVVDDIDDERLEDIIDLVRGRSALNARRILNLIYIMARVRLLMIARQRNNNIYKYMDMWDLIKDAIDLKNYGILEK